MEEKAITLEQNQYFLTFLGSLDLLETLMKLGLIPRKTSIST